MGAGSAACESEGSGAGVGGDKRGLVAPGPCLTTGGRGSFPVGPPADTGSCKAVAGWSLVGTATTGGPGSFRRPGHPTAPGGRGGEAVVLRSSECVTTPPRPSFRPTGAAGHSPRSLRIRQITQSPTPAVTNHPGGHEPPRPGMIDSASRKSGHPRLLDAPTSRKPSRSSPRASVPGPPGSDNHPNRAVESRDQSGPEGHRRRQRNRSRQTFWKDQNRNRRKRNRPYRWSEPHEPLR
ncbi:hypothetical protein GA0070619_2137 [Micromonospora zamorensis]|nr:hypothetical protein GA0070619_2137 [Micromonospora zamorensis]